MDTPICDFVRAYAQSGVSRMHMPGHKGKPFLGCEAMDITEIRGADALYEAEGVIAQSEANAARLFGTARTLYSTEGSSQGIRAMVFLALTNRRDASARPVLVASRNAHKALLYACALLDVDIKWLWDDEKDFSLCRCRVSARALGEALDNMDGAPFAVYVTSPDYLGGTLDIASLAEVAHARGIPLLVDNAHGAYLRFLPENAHPVALGADACCDSAHKTLPVLTGGAYLHIAPRAARWCARAKEAMAMFGSTSPSYLILQSLDLANRYIDEGYAKRLRDCARRAEYCKAALRQKGFCVEPSDPLKITVRSHGVDLSARLRAGGVECEYEDPDYTVFMCTPENGEDDFARVLSAAGEALPAYAMSPALSLMPPRAVRAVREAMFAPCETVAAKYAEGRVLAAPAVGCPPAVSVVVSGEEIGADAVRALAYYHMDAVRVTR